MYFSRPDKEGALRLVAYGEGADALVESLLREPRKLVAGGTAGRDAKAIDMAAAASAADVAIIIVDAREGVAPWTRHHGYLVSLFGIPHVVFAIDRTDEADDSPQALARIEDACGELARQLALPRFAAVAVSRLPEYLDKLPSASGSATTAAVETAHQFEAALVWLGDAPMLPGRNYPMKLGDQAATATVAPLKYKVNARTLEHVAATKLDRNEIGIVQLELDRPVAYAPYAANRELGGFLLLDSATSRIAGIGMLHFALRRAQNVHWQALDVDRAARAKLKGQKPCVLWFTGLSASGKSTIANLVEKRLHAMGRHTYLLDGDNVRHGLNKDLGFTEAARVENIRRVAEVAALMTDAGLIVLAAFISPFRSERRMARELLPAGQFLEVFVDTPLAVAEARDPKGLYRKARRGELKNFTGIDSPYEPPEHAEIRIDGGGMSPEQAAELVVAEMGRRGL